MGADLPSQRLDYRGDYRRLSYKTTKQKENTMKKENIIAALRAFAGQRPGLDYANYGDPSSYRSESRRITRQLNDFRHLARTVELSGITAEELEASAKLAYSGRLSLVERGDKIAVDYCTGQYWPTEYRAAACAVLANALWNYYRSDIPKDAERPGDLIRAKFRRMFGANIHKRWFD